jgi:DNA-binding NtrC family response regulator
MPTILIVEDDAVLADSLLNALKMEGHAVEAVGTAEAGLARARERSFDVVVTDLQLPGQSGLDLVGQLHAAKPHLPIVMMTAYHATETAIEATKRGAFDYILKGSETTEHLIEMIEKAVQQAPPAPESVLPAADTAASHAIIGESRAMQEVYKQIGRVAAKPVTVLVRGETGTGKELVARALRAHSDRKDRPFVTVNCAAIPETLLESDLFGHERGAFTGADSRRIGRFEQATGGTIFLDEIGDISPHIQAKLLRVLQEKTINRLGGKEPIAVDARVIAATHCDLEKAIEEKTFREDLYYRLNDAVIRLPPLRERLEDIPGLANHFLHRHGPAFGCDNPAIAPEAIGFLQRQPWPGNVRELENVVRKAMLRARPYSIEGKAWTIVSLEDIQAALAVSKAPRPGADQSVASYVSNLLSQATRGELENVNDVLTEAVERELYSQAIQLAEGNQAKAAKWLGVSRPTMRQKLTLYGLRPSENGEPV